MVVEGWSDEAILDAIGSRLRTERLNRNLTAEDVADRAGVSALTVYNVERGGNPSLRTLIRILRALDLVGRIDALLPETPVSPIQLARLQGRRRRRATGSRGRDRSEDQW